MPRASTCDTSSGLMSKPKLPPAATNALAVAPALKCRTAINRKKVVAAVSRIPAETARQRS